MKLTTSFSSLRDINYRWFWLGVVTAFGGAQMQQLAQSWLVYEMTGSPLALGVMGVAWGLPILLLSPFGGVMADRMSRRKLIMASECLVGVVNLILATLVFFQAVTFWQLLAGAVVRGVSFSFSAPGRQSFISDLVRSDEIMNAIALNSAGVNTMRIVAPAVGGALVVAIGVAGTFYVSAACSLAGILLLLRVRVTGGSFASASKEPFGLLTEGLRYIKRSPDIVALLSLAFIPILFGMPYMYFLPVFAADILKVGAPGLGWLTGTTGLGALLGSLIIASMPQGAPRGKIMLFLSIAFGAALVLFSQSQNFMLSLILLLGVGLAGTSYISLNNTLLQTMADAELRGRVLGIYIMTWALMPLGALPISAIAEVIGTPIAIAIGGGIVVACSAWAYFKWPNLRRM